MNSTQSTDLQALLFVAIIVWRLVRKTRERPVKTDAQRWRLPLILVVIGGFETSSLIRGAHPITFSSADLAYLVIVSAVSVLLGLLRGTTIRIADRGGVLTQRYSPLTIALWLGSVAVRLGLDMGASHVFGVSGAVTGTSILMMFGLSLLGESVAVALRTGGFGAGAGNGTGGNGPGIGGSGFGGRGGGRAGFDRGVAADRVPADRGRGEDQSWGR